MVGFNFRWTIQKQIQRQTIPSPNLETLPILLVRLLPRILFPQAAVLVLAAAAAGAGVVPADLAAGPDVVDVGWTAVFR